MSAERLFDLARHLTERDREIVRMLFEQQLLTTDQLTLLFFSSKRRAQDRLLFLYQHRVLDRFYPARPFGSGKAQAHWLLDEAGAILVAAQLGVERKKLGLQRRDDWGSHPQLAHRLGTNRFVTDLVAATLTDPTLGVTVWRGPAQAARRFDVSKHLSTPRPDGGFELVGPAGRIECHLEWDRGTETKERLEGKLFAYLEVHEVWERNQSPPINLLVVVPGPGRLLTVEAAVSDLRGIAEARGYPFFNVWGVYGATALDLRRQGPLAPVWWPLAERGPASALPGMLPRTSGGDPSAALGRRWLHDRADFWNRLSPLGRAAPAAAEVDLRSSEIAGYMDDPEPDEEG